MELAAWLEQFVRSLPSDRKVPSSILGPFEIESSGDLFFGQSTDTDTDTDTDNFI